LFRSETDSRGVAFQKKEEKYFKKYKKGRNREFARKNKNYENFEKTKPQKLSKNLIFEKRKIQGREK